jgi:hypothetical protein
MHAHRLVLAMIVSASILGCASPELPTPRHAIVPMPVNDLAARQVDDTAILTFTLPTLSTDMQPLADVPSVEIYRSNAQSPTAAVKATGKNSKAGRLVEAIPSETIDQYRRNGQIEFPDKLAPAELTNAGGTEITYTVRTRVSRAKDSADSNRAGVRVYPPLSPVHDLRATLTETAVLVDWSLTPSTAGGADNRAVSYRIYRAEVDPTTAQAAIANPAQAKLIAPLVQLAQTRATEYRDTNFQFGHTYFYTVRNVEQFGPELVESAESTPAVLTAKDIFPPATPQGVEAVAVPAVNDTPAAIELTWTIDTENDLAGYNVYRSEQSDQTGQKLNSETLLVPTFRDISVLPGKDYFYRVGAIDQSGNESPLSPAIEAQVPEP